MNDTHIQELDPWLTEREAARRLRVSVSTIRNERKRGRLGFARVGKRVLIPMSVLEAYKQAATTVPCPITNSLNSTGPRAGTLHGPTVDAPDALRRGRQIASRHSRS